jgi:HAD superfamily hydrolase (TIGR01509 family)
MQRYAAVLLDLDGTLVDSNDAHAHAWVETLGQHGIEVAFERVRDMIGMGGDHVIEQLTGWPRDGHKARVLQDQCTAIFVERWLRDVKPIDQTRDFVLRLRHEEYQIVLASAAHEAALRPLLEIAGLADLLDAGAQPPKPDESKPDPAAIEIALSRVGVDPSRVLMIGDTPDDIEAARAAHVDVLAFTTGGYTPEALAGAIAVYCGPSDLLAHWAESPLGNREAP